MTVGSGVAKTGGCVLLYRSRTLEDAANWEYLHFLTSGQWNRNKTPNPCDDGEMWECPDFFALDGGHVLIYSTLGKVFWQSGHLDPATMKFHPARPANSIWVPSTRPRPSLMRKGAGFSGAGSRKSAPTMPCARLVGPA